MKNKIYLLATIGSLWCANLANAQVRQDLNTGLTSVEKDTLVTLMQQYIDSKIIEYHCDYVDRTGGAQQDIHSDFDFLPFHRVYLEGMEDYLILKGHPEFVPLPSWAPNTSTPTLFRVVDSDCSSASAVCDNGVTNNPSIDCSTSINWTPTVPRPRYLSLPIQTGLNNDLCDWTFSPDTAGMTDPNGLSNTIENPYHDNVHANFPNGMRGAMSWFTSPSAPIFWN